MPDIYDRLLTYWKRRGIFPATHRATPLEIAAWEQKYGLRLPTDLREYVMRVNGFLHAETLEFDNQGNSLLPLSAMVPEEEWASRPSHFQRFVFADHMIQCSWWCFRLSTDFTETTAFYLGGQMTLGHDRLIASSVEEFLELYIADSPRFYGGT
jgi:hypothetical protein